MKTTGQEGQVDYWFSLQTIVLVLLAAIVIIVALPHLPYLKSTLERVAEWLARCCF